MSSSKIRWLKRVWNDVGFARRKKSFMTPPGDPHMDEPTRACFGRQISTAKVYVEYGSGGATIVAAQNAELIVSVESDRVYRGLVLQKLSEIESPADVRLLHGRIGPTAEWGAPILRAGLRAVSGEAYANAPWSELAKERRAADLVLIDGRYRVSCLLTSLLHPLGKDAVYLFDDFEGRPHYHVVLDYMDILERPGRSILAKRREVIDEASCAALRRENIRDWR